MATRSSILACQGTVYGVARVGHNWVTKHIHRYLCIKTWELSPMFAALSFLLPKGQCYVWCQSRQFRNKEDVSSGRVASTHIISTIPVPFCLTRFQTKTPVERSSKVILSSSKDSRYSWISTSQKKKKKSTNNISLVFIRQDYSLTFLSMSNDFLKRTGW